MSIFDKFKKMLERLRSSAAGRARLAAILLLALAGASLGAGVLTAPGKAAELPYADFCAMLDAGAVERVEASGGRLRVICADGSEYSAADPDSEALRERILLSGSELTYASRTNPMTVAAGALGGLGLVALLASFARGREGSGMSVHDVSAGSAEAAAKSGRGEPPALSFAMVAGQDEAIAGLRDIVGYLRAPEKFNAIGARMPRGVLLYGPPGTGKTLLARALAGEAGVPFLSVNGSDFVQMYVGVGAKRVRELFERAHGYGRCVVFIDEIDAIGKRRSDGSDSERDQTLNALLTQMSGFEAGDGIVVVAATNRIDTLDSALTRPGRFDRHIEIGMPDVEARRRIIEIVLRDKKAADGVDAGAIARQTTGFSGAALESMINEAAIYAVREGRERIESEDITRAFTSTVAGEERSAAAVSQQDRRVCAVHEAGHAAAAALILPEERVRRITIVPSTRGAGGYVLREPAEGLATRSLMERQVIMAYAGRAAEEVAFGKDNITRGAAGDIEQATRLISAMIGEFGMDEQCGLLTYRQGDPAVTEARRKLSAALYARAQELVRANGALVAAIAAALLERETLDAEAFYQIVEKSVKKAV